KSVKFDWGEKEEAAFQTLKQKLCSAPILALPEGSENFVVYFDASHKGLGAICLEPKGMDQANTSSSFGYDDQNELNMRQHRWLELLSDYDCEIRYHPRKVNVMADALSRKAQNEERNEENYGNEDLGGIIKKLESCTDRTLCLNERNWIPYHGSVESQHSDLLP
nr:reverse transcriptase domain-containing protein [Tanacetum cinerariifolium]